MARPSPLFVALIAALLATDCPRRHFYRRALQEASCLLLRGQQRADLPLQGVIARARLDEKRRALDSNTDAPTGSMTSSSADSTELVERQIAELRRRIAGVAALGLPGEYYQQIRKEYAERRDLMLEVLAVAGYGSRRICEELIAEGEVFVTASVGIASHGFHFHKTNRTTVSRQVSMNIAPVTAMP